MTISSGAPYRTRLVHPAKPFTNESPRPSLDIAVIGFDSPSSGSDGLSRSFQSLLKEFSRRGHRVHFYGRYQPHYAGRRSLPSRNLFDVHRYDGIEDLAANHAHRIRYADAVILGSGLTDRPAVSEWVLSNARGVVAYYDFDTTRTLGKLERGDHESGCGWISADVISEFDLYLSTMGGPALTRLESEFGARQALPLYVSVDPEAYYPIPVPLVYDLGYIGTHCSGRQPGLEQHLAATARRWNSGRFVVAGTGYPVRTDWPHNVERIDHLPSSMHRRFYNSQRFALNITRRDVRSAGYEPSSRLFEAAACGTPVISDDVPGIETFFEAGRELLISHSTADTLRYLQAIDDEEAVEIGRAARRRVLESHTAAHRAAELENHLANAIVNVPAQP